MSHRHDPDDDEEEEEATYEQAAGSDGHDSDSSNDQGAPAAAPPALLAFKDRLLAARIKLEGGAWRLSASAQQLLGELLRYRDALLPLATAASAARRRGVRYMANRCSAALTLLAAEPQLSPGTLALVLEDLRLSAALVGLPRLLGELR
jgi:hypothetical protein